MLLYMYFLDKYFFTCFACVCFSVCRYYLPVFCVLCVYALYTDWCDDHDDDGMELEVYFLFPFFRVFHVCRHSELVQVDLAKRIDALGPRRRTWSRSNNTSFRLTCVVYCVPGSFAIGKWWKSFVHRRRKIHPISTKLFIITMGN